MINFIICEDEKDFVKSTFYYKKAYCKYFDSNDKAGEFDWKIRIDDVIYAVVRAVDSCPEMAEEYIPFTEDLLLYFRQ